MINGTSETIINESKEQKGGCVGMLLGTLDAILLGNLLTNKGVYAGDGVIQLVKEDSKEIRRTMNN